MGAMGHFKENVAQVLHSIEDGWHEISRRANTALTHFKPSSNEAKDPQSVERPRWGLLAADVRDEPRQIVVRIEAPGMDAEDFDIRANGRRLSVCGEKRVERSNSNGDYQVRQCAYGRFRRDMILPEQVSEDGVKASYHRGVLEIALPKATTGHGRKVRVREAG